MHHARKEQVEPERSRQRDRKDTQRIAVAVQPHQAAHEEDGREDEAEGPLQQDVGEHGEHGPNDGPLLARQPFALGFAAFAADTGELDEGAGAEDDAERRRVGGGLEALRGDGGVRADRGEGEVEDVGEGHRFQLCSSSTRRA